MDLCSLPKEIQTQIIDALDDKGIIALGLTSKLWRALLLSYGSSLQFSIMKSLKDPWDIFEALKYLGNRPGEAMGLCLLVLDAQIPWLYLKREDGSDTEMESDEMETESEDGSEDDADDDSDDGTEDGSEDGSEDDGGDESENDSYTNDCSMPSLDNLGFIDIQPQLEDAETEMLKLIWSISSYKRRYYDQEGLAIARRILATKGAKLFFVDSKRPSLRHQMLNAVASGLTPEQKQFIHLILVFWAKVEVIELANDLLQKQPSPEQEQILHFLGNSKELFNPEKGQWFDNAISECNLTRQTSKRLVDLADHYCRFATQRSIERMCESFKRLNPRLNVETLVPTIAELLPALLVKVVEEVIDEERAKRRLNHDVEEKDLIGRD